MASLSRHEVKELIAKFKEKHFPKYKPGTQLIDHIGNGDTLYPEIGPLEHELNHTTGPLGPCVKNRARILKHFIEMPAGPEVLQMFNFAMHRVRYEGDATRVIKRLRIDWAAHKKQQEEQLKKLPKVIAEINEAERRLSA